jgi:hypothetical protein
VANDNADRSATGNVIYSTKPYVDMNAVSSDDTITPEIPKKRYLSIVQWHRRLGRLNKADLLRLNRDPDSGVGIKGSKELPFCEICVKARHTRRHSKKPRPRAVRPIEQVHLDLAGGGKQLDLDSHTPKEDDEIDPSRNLESEQNMF